MTRRVLIVGSGGREHALCWRLAADGDVDVLLVAPGNPGMADVARVEPVDITNATGLVGLVRRESIDLVIIGPEAPLVAGLADELRARPRSLRPHPRAA